MNRAWDFLPQGLRDRPFDLYTAIALIAVGIYGFFDPYFPEKTTTALSALLYTVVELYFIVASAVLATAILIPTRKYPHFSYFGQMVGWAFIAAAGIAVMTYQFFYNLFVPVVSDNIAFYWLVFFVFGCVGWAAFFRASTMYIQLLQFNKEIKNG